MVSDSLFLLLCDFHYFLPISSFYQKNVPELFPSFGTFKKVVTEFGQGFNAKVHICENMNTDVFISKLTHASIQTVNPSISAPP